MDKKIPGYMSRYKIPIIGKREFPSLNIVEVMEYFKQNNFRDTLTYTNYRSGYYEKKAKKKLFKNIKNFKPKQIIEIGYHLKDYLWRDPIVYITPVCFMPPSTFRNMKQ